MMRKSSLEFGETGNGLSISLLGVVEAKLSPEAMELTITNFNRNYFIHI